MTDPLDPELDLCVERVIRASPDTVWRAWTEPESLAKWWIPAPTACRVVELDARAGGGFRTEMSHDGQFFEPHLTGCFLHAVPSEMLVFTTTLSAGWRPVPAELPMTAVIRMAAHPEGTAYSATAMHRSPGERSRHRDLGFADGWGTVTRQLAELVEATPGPAASPRH